MVMALMRRNAPRALIDQYLYSHRFASPDTPARTSTGEEILPAAPRKEDRGDQAIGTLRSLNPLLSIKDEVSGFAEGMQQGGANLVRRAMNQPVTRTVGQAYRQAKQAEEAGDEQFTKDHPDFAGWNRLVANVVPGALATLATGGAAAVPALIKLAAPLTGRALRIKQAKELADAARASAGVMTAFGAVNRLGEGEGIKDRLTRASDPGSMVFDASLGAAIPPALKLVGPLAQGTKELAKRVGQSPLVQNLVGVISPELKNFMKFTNQVADELLPPKPNRNPDLAPPNRNPDLDPSGPPVLNNNFEANLKKMIDERGYTSNALDDSKLPDETLTQVKARQQVAREAEKTARQVDGESPDPTLRFGELPGRPVPYFPDPPPDGGGGAAVVPLPRPVVPSSPSVVTPSETLTQARAAANEQARRQAARLRFDPETGEVLPEIPVPRGNVGANKMPIPLLTPSETLTQAKAQKQARTPWNTKTEKELQSKTAEYLDLFNQAPTDIIAANPGFKERWLAADPSVRQHIAYRLKYDLGAAEEFAKQAKKRATLETANTTPILKREHHASDYFGDYDRAMEYIRDNNLPFVPQGNFKTPGSINHALDALGLNPHHRASAEDIARITASERIARDGSDVSGRVGPSAFPDPTITNTLKAGPKTFLGALRDKMGDERGFIGYVGPDGLKNPRFYSRLQEHIQGMDFGAGKAKPAQSWLAQFTKGGKFSQEEYEMVLKDALEDAAKQGKSLTRAEVMALGEANPVTIREIRKGEASAGLDDYLAHSLRSGHGTKHGRWVEPGGTNYREVLLQLERKGGEYDPSKLRVERIRPSATQGGSAKLFYDGQEIVHYNDIRLEGGKWVGNTPAEWQQIGRGAFIKKQWNADFTDPHWEEPNVLAHVRMNDRVGPNGEKVLHVEEVQSDWHQKGREEGYRGPEATEAELAAARDRVHSAGTKWRQALADARLGRGEGNVKQLAQDIDDADLALNKLTGQGTTGVPDAPFKETMDWTGLAMKRVIDEAADGGYDRVSWTGGERQADRYSLAKHVSKITYEPGSGYLRATAPHGTEVLSQKVTPAELPGIIGKKAAQRLVGSPVVTPIQGMPGHHVLQGDDLTVGGEGMKGYYGSQATPDKGILPEWVKAYAKKKGVALEIEPVAFGNTNVANVPSFRMGELRDKVGRQDLGSIGADPYLMLLGTAAASGGTLTAALYAQRKLQQLKQQRQGTP